VFNQLPAPGSGFLQHITSSSRLPALSVTPYHQLLPAPGFGLPLPALSVTRYHQRLPAPGSAHHTTSPAPPGSRLWASHNVTRYHTLSPAAPRLRMSYSFTSSSRLPAPAYCSI